MAHELRLLFAKTKDGDVFVRPIDSTGGGSVPEKPFQVEVTEDGYEDLRWYLEEYMDLPDAGSVVRARRIEAAIKRWGKELCDALFDSREGGELLDGLLQGEPPRLLTIATDNSDLLRLPWELIADRRGPLTRQGVTIRRQLEQGGKSRELRVELPLRLLIVVSRPADLGFIDPRATTPAMLDALEPLGGDVTIDFCRPPTVARMEEMLAAATDRGEPYHVVHFEGHGTFVPEIGLGALCFEKPSDDGAPSETDYARADRLGNLLATHRVPVAILEACRSSMTGKVPAFRSVAPRLVEAGVGSVVAMSHSVHVEATKILLERFYREIVVGKTLGQALEAGRGALIAQPHRWIEAGPRGRTVELQDWFLPTLYQQGDDVPLVPKDAVRPAPMSGGQVRAARRQPPESREPGAFPRPPIYRFHGRAKELYKLEQELRRHRTVLLHAMGGMGKTSLAREAAYWWTRTGLFPDGACFVSFEQGAGADHAALVLGTYLDGTAFESLPAAEQRKRARQLFDERRVLMVWDNFESVLPAFQPGADGGAVLYSDEERGRIVELYRDWTDSEKGHGRLLVTCRPAEAGLLGASRMELHGLARPDSLHLLARVLDVHGLDFDDPRLERDGLKRLLKVLDDHPLSVELVTPHLKTMTPLEIVDDFGALLETFKGDAEVERNQSLLASLEFSVRRLGEAAQVALPWLGLFRGGVFEANLLNISKLESNLWAVARQELEATALVRVERDVKLNHRPYLHFHPTLAYRAADEAAAPDEVRQRFVGLYLGFRWAAHQALRGSSPRGGMEVMAREEANFRRAVSWALDGKGYAEAAAIGITFGLYLERSGRLRERVSWIDWLAVEVDQEGSGETVVELEREVAWSRFLQGQAEEAVDRVEGLLERLRVIRDFDPGVQLAATQQALGRIYYSLGLAERAIPILRDAVGQWKALIEKKKANGEKASTELEHLSAALTELANALMIEGYLVEALEEANRAVSILRELGNDYDIAAILSTIARILVNQGRFQDAEAHYQEILEVARRAGDWKFEAATLQHLGALAADRERYPQAASLYMDALKIYQEMNYEEGIMQTCNMLGIAEQYVGRLAEARAWYERSSEIACRRRDQQNMAIAAHNFGILFQFEGEAARKAGDETTARRLFGEAVASVRQSLLAKEEMGGSQPLKAGSHSQLAQIYLLLDDVDQATEHAHEARKIRERLSLKEVWKDYNTLANIARARGDDAQAAEWQRKRHDLLAELERRAGGPSLNPEAMQAILSLAVACARAGVEGAELPPQAEGVLAQLGEAPTPFDALVPFLRGLAKGETVSVPEGLPAELGAALGQMVEAVREAGRG